MSFWEYHFCNSYSEIIVTPSSSALFFLLGPILSPATKKFVFEDTEETIFPPLVSINLLMHL